MNRCLTEEVVLDFIEGRLSPAALALAEAHAEQCTACTELIAAAAGAVLQDPASSRGVPASERGEGRRIGSYRLVKPLGHGGAGIVYRAVHVASGEEVAIKTVRADAHNVLASIRREIRALSRLRHPGVVRILDQGVDEGRPWYAMELIAGRTLHEHLHALHAGSTKGLRLAEPGSPPCVDGAPLPELPLAGILGAIRHLAYTLAFLHGQGVVHHDLTPRNVVLRPDGTTVLVDFGLALRDERPGRDLLEATMLVAGTLPYMAPEQIRGEVIDPRADLYALGAILYQAVVGRPPFSAGSPLDLAMAHLGQTPVPPSVFAPWIDPSLEALILRLLEKRPRDRIGYAEDVAAVLAPLCGAEALGDGALRARAYVYRPGFAGRHDLVERFEGLLAGAGKGRGAAVLVGGKSGVGKTRFAAELATQARALGFRIVIGECVSLGERGAALHPFRPLLRALVDSIRDRGSAASLSATHARALSVFEPELGTLLDDAQPESELLAPQAARRRLLAALEAAFVALVDEAPLLLVLDDLQWADELSLDFLEALLPDFFAKRQILLVGTYRSEETTPQLERALRAPFVENIMLERLSSAAIEAMVGDMLALDRVPAALLERLSSTSEGNPFFVAEYLRAAVDEGWIVRELGAAWQLAENTSDGGPPGLPGSLTELIERRFAVLTAPARRLLDAAAVLGKKAELKVLVTTAELSESEGLDALGELLARTMLEEASGDRFRLVHDKIREIAYGAITEPLRCALHRRAASVLEQSGASPPSDAVLAHHWARAGVVTKAIDYFERAGETALRTAAHAEAASCFEQALELNVSGDPAGATASSSERRARWERRIGEAYYALGDLPRCEAHSARALAGFGHAPPRSRFGWVLMLVAQLARQLWHLAAPGRGGKRSIEERARLQEVALAAARLAHRYYFAEDGLALVSSALLSVNLAERASVEGLVTEPYAQLGYLAGACKLRSLAKGYFAIAKRGAEAAGDMQQLATVLSHEALYLAGDGHLGAASTAAERALAGLSGVREPQESEGARIILAHIDYLAGRYTASRAHGSQLVASSRARANHQHEAFGRYAIARCLVREGRFDEAWSHLERARALLDGRADDLSESIRLGLAALVHQGRGELALAESAADSAIAAIARARPAPFSLADGYHGAAEVYLDLWRRSIEQGKPAGSLPARARRAGAAMRRFALLFRIGVPPYLLFLGRARALAGRRILASLAFRRARRTAEKIGMPYEAAQAERALGELAGSRRTKWTAHP